MATIEICAAWGHILVPCRVPPTLKSAGVTAVLQPPPAIQVCVLARARWWHIPWPTIRGQNRIYERAESADRNVVDIETKAAHGGWIGHSCRSAIRGQFRESCIVER